MPSIDLTPYNQPQGTTSDGTKFDNMLAAVQAVLNALDNGNIAPAAAIAYTKLALAGKINLSSDVDTATSLAIARLAGYPADSSKALFGDGTWATVGAANVGTQLDYAQITTDATTTATTEGTSTSVITGASVAYDGTKNRIEFWCPAIYQSGGATTMTFVLYRDTTVLGQVPVDLTGAHTAAPTTVPVSILAYDTPTVAAHTYKVFAFVNAATGKVSAGTGASGTLRPAHLRVTKA